MSAKNGDSRSPWNVVDASDFDVAILGAGIAGTMLAAILARKGHRVLLVEKEAHPRFALGESMILETSEMMRITATRFDVPEIGHLSTIQTSIRHIGTSCGVKKNFGFLYHREGQAQRPEEATQIPIPDAPYGHELHMFRQDIDAYMLAVAVRNGAVYKQRTDVTDVRFHDTGVELVCADGRLFTAKFVADAGGYRSLLATKLSLRPKPLAALTHSRALFTHMVGIKHYHTFGHSLAEHGLPSPLHQGTLHHIFEGGWFWIIPFNNHPESTNPLCSIGLNLDPRRYPKTNKSPDAELNEFLVRFPSIAPHFKGARLVRDWVNTDRLQYSATQVVGDRWCLMGHAAGAVDALFSRGLFHTTATVHIVADRLLRALSDGQFTRERFKRIEEVVLTGLAYNDRTVACSYAAFSNFDLWNAWYRVYGLGAFLESLKLTRAHLKYEETGDATFLEVLEGTPFRSLGGGLDAWATLFDGAASLVEAAEKGTTSPSNAARGIYELLGKADYVPPALDITSPARRYLSDVSMPGLMKLIAWGKLKAPRYVRDLYFDIDTSVMLSEQMKWLPITLKLQQNPVVRHLAGLANGQ